MIAPFLLGLIVVLLVIGGIRRAGHRSLALANPHKLPLPPGPTMLSFIRGLINMSKEGPFLTFTIWAKTYGDIVYVRALRDRVIFLNTEKVAIELLEKRSQKYSNRPPDPTADLFGWEWPTANARYGPRFRLHRRLLHQFFNAQAILTQHPKQVNKAYDLAMHLLDDPLHYMDHFTTYSAALVMEVAYGYNSKGNEGFATMMGQASHMVISASTFPVMTMCSTFPFVKTLPSWLPGMEFKAHADECRHLTAEALNAPYEWVKRQIKEGSAAPSMVADAIGRYGLDDDSKDPGLALAVKESAGSLYAAAVDTMNSTLAVFVYLMMNYPEVQRRAQAEIDSVVGGQRLPDLEDRISLPYVNAVMRETIRWYPVAPMAIPHTTTEDDVYQGYYIPQGAMIIPNVWAMSRNEEKYPNPEAFTPERFFNEDGTLNDDKASWIFGFGRRICPGRHVADVSLWLAIACILVLFRIEKTEGSDNVKWSPGIISFPLPFPCKFVPRDKGMDGRKLMELVDASRVSL